MSMTTLSANVLIVILMTIQVKCFCQRHGGSAAVLQQFFKKHYFISAFLYQFAIEKVSANVALNCSRNYESSRRHVEIARSSVGLVLQAYTFTDLHSKQTRSLLS